ncbi:NAD(P)-binding domain-containing protein [Chimaeribacter arupi]|uniref:NAD(P)-binding domain-containing protein n=1 Tax=Chimaeribacter arupi TaxID=2060066 RepID=UPI001F4EBD17|nr:NAD(P)-binding domain-containing protein [Chimaeribacter arupi]
MLAPSQNWPESLITVPAVLERKMKRVGILGVDLRAEGVIKALFKAAPDAQVFLSPGNSEAAQNAAREYPCWTLDNHQAVVDEADIIFINTAPAALPALAGSIALRPSHTLISLVPGVQISELRQRFTHFDCARALLAPVNDAGHSVVILTAGRQDITPLSALFGSVNLLSRESEFNVAETALR